MADQDTQCAIEHAALAISSAKRLLITAGAGMGVDSSLPDFRGDKGLWQAYPALQSRGISFSAIANPAAFERNAELAWAFYGHRWQLYRDTHPHPGFSKLLHMGRAMPGGYFVFTSNVDGQFQKAGFDSIRVMECHGSIHRLQCTRPCGDHSWTEQHDLASLKIDAERLTVEGRLPKCPECGAIARPNVLMFGDFNWITEETDSQHTRYCQWLELSRGYPLVIIELGAGSGITSVRSESESVAVLHDATLIRINPTEPEGPPNSISLPMPAFEALERIAAQLPKRLRAAEPEPETNDGPDESAPSATITVKSHPHIPGRADSPEERDRKWQHVYARAFSVALPNGVNAHVEQLHIERTYAALIDGLPMAGCVDAAIRRAEKRAREVLYGPDPIVVPPLVDDPLAEHPILPRLCFFAHISVTDRYKPYNWGSPLNLVFFAEINDEKPPKEFVREALSHVHWESQCSPLSDPEDW